MAATSGRYRARRDGRWIGAVILIAIGVIGLAVNFDLLPRDILVQAWKLWPVIPFVLGLGFLMRRRDYPDDVFRPKD